MVCIWKSHQVSDSGEVFLTSHINELVIVCNFYDQANLNKLVGIYESKSHFMLHR